MRRMAAVMLTIGLLLGVASPATASQEYDYIVAYEQPSPHLIIIVDLVTGVEYIVTDNGICPRYDANGELFTADKEQ